MQGASPVKFDIEEAWKVYQAEGSVHRAGHLLGISGQQLHKRFQAAGYKLRGASFTDEDDATIRAYYADTPPASFDLHALTKLLKRPHHSNVCRRARELGLTQQDRPKNSKTRAAMATRAKGQWDRRPHPRGMSGKHHTSEAREALAAIGRKWWDGMPEQAKDDLILKRLKARKASTPPAWSGAHRKRSWKSAWRVVGGQRVFFRSRWEANYARYLETLRKQKQIKTWEHEPETFWFEGIKRGCVSYLPDFRVTFPDGRVEYHEVKGWMDARSKTKLKRMAKYHPEVVMVLIDGPVYRKLERGCRDTVPEWECK